MHAFTPPDMLNKILQLYLVLFRTVTHTRENKKKKKRKEKGCSSKIIVVWCDMYRDLWETLQRLRAQMSWSICLAI